MALQHRFTYLPPDAEILSPHAAIAHDEDGYWTVFNASGPIFRFREDDTMGRRMAAAVLTDPALGLAQPQAAARVLGWHRSRIFEYRKRFQEHGVEGLEPQRTGPRGPHKLQGATLCEAQRLLDQRGSNRRVAKEVGVSEGARAPDDLESGEGARRQPARAVRRTSKSSLGRRCPFRLRLCTKWPRGAPPPGVVQSRLRP